MAGGFWEEFANQFSGAMNTYNQNKVDKRKRALEKLKFITENMDVGSQVDPTAASEIQDYAPEGAPMIKDNSYTGTPDQQRMSQFRDLANSGVDDDTLMQKGTALGAVSPNQYGNHIMAKESRATREQLAREAIQSRENIADERNQTALMLRGMINANRGGGGGNGEDGALAGSPFATKHDRLKWLGARRAVGGNPYQYVTETLMKNPQYLKGEFSNVLKESGVPTYDLDKYADPNNPDAWDKYASYHEDPEVRTINMLKLGLKENEYAALIAHIRRMAQGKREGR